MVLLDRDVEAAQRWDRLDKDAKDIRDLRIEAYAACQQAWRRRPRDVYYNGALRGAVVVLGEGRPKVMLSIYRHAWFVLFECGQCGAFLPSAPAYSMGELGERIGEGLTARVLRMHRCAKPPVAKSGAIEEVMRGNAES